MQKVGWGGAEVRVGQDRVWGRAGSRVGGAGARVGQCVGWGGIGGGMGMGRN